MALVAFLFSLVSHCIAMRGKPRVGPPLSSILCVFFSFQPDLVLFVIYDGD